MEEKNFSVEESTENISRYARFCGKYLMTFQHEKAF